MVEGFGLKWGLYHTFNVMAGGDYFKLERIEKEPLGAILYFLAYQSDVTKLNAPKS